MADVSTKEHKGKSEEQKKALKDFRDALGISKDFVRPRFQTAVRMYRLFAGQLPPEINGTFSKIMLWIPYSIINRELAGAMKKQLEGADWFDVTANEYSFEPTADVAKKWLKHQMEKVQQFSRTSLPTFQNSYIFGNGYRFYGHHYQETKTEIDVPREGLMGVVEGIDQEVQTTSRSVITGQHLNYFNVFPSPNGGIINPQADTMEAGLDYLIVNMYMPKSFISSEAERGNFDKDEVARLFTYNKDSEENDPSIEYKKDMLNTDASWSEFAQPEWVSRMKAEGVSLPSRYRLSWFFRRDTWTIVAEDNYVLYHGKPLLDVIPVANFKHSPNLDNFYGFSLLETVEDVIVSMILNFNMRFDYLAGQFHPPKFVPQRLVDDVGGDMGKFDWSPYNVQAYQHTAFAGGLDQYMFTDKMPELSQQAFMEQGQLQEYLEDTISQHGAQSMNANTATVGSLLSSNDAAPKMLRAINNEITGVKDSLELTLRFGAKYKNENETIRTGRAGMPWEEIDHEAIANGYGIEVTGATKMAHSEEIFKKQLSMAPMFLNNPAIQGQMELNKQLLEGGGFKNIDIILNGEQADMPQMPQGAEQKMPGGIPSLQNESASTMGRSGPPALSAMAAGV